MAEKDATARLRRAVKENNLFLVKRLIQRTDMRNPDPGPKRYTSLAWAAVLGHEETFEFLLNEGHDDEELSKDLDNSTILILLADLKPSHSSPYGQSDPDFMRATLRMARLYYDRYTFIMDWADTHGKTALHVAALKGNEELARMLCDLGADVDLSDNQGNTPLHYASAWNHIPIVQLLIERGCQYAARNNDGFTPSDYAYSFSTRDTLQDTARAQYESNKKARRVFAQAAARGNEMGGYEPPSRSLDVNSVRMRSGSAASHTTSTSDSVDLDSLPSGQSYTGAYTSSPSHLHQYGSGASSSSSTGTFSVPSPTPQPSLSGNSLHPGSSNPASALSPIATRVREQDANAIEKYLMSRNRSGSGSTDQKSQNSSNPSSAGPSANGDDISSLPTTGSRRRLRPSLSAAQLRTNPKPPFIITTRASQDMSRNHTEGLPDPPSSSSPSFSPPSSTLPLPPTSSRLPPSRGSSLNAIPPTTPEPKNYYTGPSSHYAQFPEPPGSPDGPSPNGTPTVTNTPTSARRLPFHILSKPLPSMPSLEHVGHRRGASIQSMR
ncbi:ankyrin [Auriscalpium vulgare]|uniref:Ankyrin n=1 Tax=Auriscalpium vulgare TaxID=40419 RepID=A0ACB8S908_9AGAM|nr:ankyrin [Auriscalpium vulgare]